MSTEGHTPDTKTVQLIAMGKVGTCMDCAIAQTIYACMSCERYLCTGCARSPFGCPNCNDNWDERDVGPRRRGVGDERRHEENRLYAQNFDLPQRQRTQRPA